MTRRSRTGGCAFAAGTTDEIGVERIQGNWNSSDGHQGDEAMEALAEQFHRAYDRRTRAA